MLAISLPHLAEGQKPYLDWVNGHETGSSEGVAICTDVNDNVLTVGLFHGTLIVQTTTGADTIVSPTAADNCFIQKSDSDGNVIWIKGIIGVGTSEIVGNAILSDSAGCIYVAGAYSGTVDFNPSNNQFLKTTSAVSEIFVLKLDASGNLAWVKTMEGNLAAYGSIAKDITIDFQNNLVLTGEYFGTVDFDPSGASEIPPPGGSVFIQKLDSAGTLIWLRTINPTTGNAIITDPVGNIYITGAIIGSADFDPGVDNYPYSSSTISYPDVYTLKLDQDGNFIWANCFGGENSDVGIDLAIDMTGSVYTLGTFYDTVDFNSGTNVYLDSAAGSQDIFIQKVDVSGNFIWSKSIGGGYYDFGKSLTIDAQANIFICGYFNTSTDLNPGVEEELEISNGFSEIFIEKLDSTGLFIWGDAIGGISGDYAEDLILDQQSNLYITGRITQTVNFNPNGNPIEITGDGITAYSAKYFEGYAGFDEVLEEPTLIIFPNPASSYINLAGITSEKLIVTIYSIDGKVIQTLILNSENVVDVSELSTGSYIIHVFTESGIHSTQLVKM